MHGTIFSIQIIRSCLLIGILIYVLSVLIVGCSPSETPSDQKVDNPLEKKQIELKAPPEKLKEEIKLVLEADEQEKAIIKESLKSKSLISEQYSIQFIEPDPSIDYKILIVEPDPNIEYKIRVIDPITGKEYEGLTKKFQKSIVPLLQKRPEITIQKPEKTN